MYLTPKKPCHRTDGHGQHHYTTVQKGTQNKVDLACPGRHGEKASEI